MNLMPWRNTTPIPIQHLHRREPFTALQAELDKTIRDFYNLFEMPSRSLADFENLIISPSIDIVEDKGSFKIEAEMPGLGKDDINVNIADGQVTIKAEKKTSRQDKDKNYIAREIGYGSYERTIALPDTANIDQAKASFKKGMLWIIIPKKAEAMQRNREIKVERVSGGEKNPNATTQQDKKERNGK